MKTLNEPSMPDSQFTHTERLASLINDKCSCLLQLGDLGGRQQQLIESGDMKQLLALLSTKQRFIALLQSTERDLATFRGEDAESRVWSSPQARARCAQQTARCRELLDEVVRQERTNEALMQQRRHVVADRLHQVHAQARASGAYRLHAGAKPKPDRSPAVVQPPYGSEYRAADQAPERATTLDVSSDIR